MPQFHQNVVGGVGDIVDGPHADGFESPRHPLRRGTHGDVLNYSAAVARTALEVRYPNPDRIMHGLPGLRDGVHRPDQGASESRRNFASYAQVSETVRTVGRHFEIEHVVHTDRRR